MKNKAIITFLLLLFNLLSYSQSPYFVNTYNGFNYKMIEANRSGSYLHAGSIMFKIDSSGNILWARSYSESGKIKRLNNGDFLIVARPSSSTNLLNLNAIRIDSLGNIVWSKNFSSSYPSYSDVCIEELSSHDLIIGFSGTYPASPTIGWIKIDENGSLTSSKSIDSDSHGYGFPIFINEYSNGDLLILKYHTDLTPNNIHAIRVNPDIDSVLWEVTIPGNYTNFTEDNFVLKNDVLSLVTRINDQTNQPFGINTIIKIDTFGNMSKKYFGPAYSSVSNIAIFDAVDNGFIATKFNRIYKLDSLYNIEWERLFNFWPQSTSSNRIHVFNSKENNIYLTFKQDVAPFNFLHIKADSLCYSACLIDSTANETFGSLQTVIGNQNFNTTLGNISVLESSFMGSSNNAPITRTVICSTALEETDTELLSFEVFPNPAVDHLTISKKSSAGYLDQFNVSVFNAQGKLVLQKEKLNSSTQLDFKNLNNGVYLILISTQKGSQTYKILKN